MWDLYSLCTFLSFLKVFFFHPLNWNSESLICFFSFSVRLSPEMWTESENPTFIWKRGSGCAVAYRNIIFAFDDCSRVLSQEKQLPINSMPRQCVVDVQRLKTVPPIDVHVQKTRAECRPQTKGTFTKQQIGLLVSGFVHFNGNIISGSLLLYRSTMSPSCRSPSLSDLMAASAYPPQDEWLHKGQSLPESWSRSTIKKQKKMSLFCLGPMLEYLV